jgi:tetratricopeptide (TPR) repeat protein
MRTTARSVSSRKKTTTPLRRHGSEFCGSGKRHDRRARVRRVCSYHSNFYIPGQTLTVLVPRNEHFEVPQHVSPVFTGQAQIGQRLETVFAPSSHERSEQRRFVLFGMGGSGKTQICLQYVYTHRDRYIDAYPLICSYILADTIDRYWGVFWIDASSHDSILLSIKQMASVLGLQQNTESVRRELANTTHTWLMVFDNADNPKVSLTGYFPTGGRGDVIVTSRNPACHQYSTVGSEEIGRMAHDEAHVLLSKTAYGQVDISKDIATAIRQLVDVLGCLALAVAQAGAYIRETQCTPVEYLQIYDRRHEELLSFLPTHSGTDYKHTVYTTWQVSIDAIASTPGEASAGALKIVRLVCFLHYDQIPLEVFFRALNGDQTQEDAAWLPWPSTLTDPLDVRHAVREAVTLLASFSLLTRDTNASLSLHPLVHEWCRKRIGEDKQRMCCLHAISLLGRSVNWNFTTEDYTFRRKMASHVQTCLQQWQNAQGGIEEGQARHWGALALVLSENGFTGKAIQLEEPLLQLRKSKLGPDHPDTLQSMNNLAIRYAEAGRREEALKLSEEVVQLRKSKLGPDHPDTLQSMNSLAVFYAEAGRREEALKLSEEVVQLRKSKLGPDHPDTIQSMGNLANRYAEAGRREEALKLSEEVLPLSKSKLGPDHPDTLQSMNNLAVFYADAGRRQEALKLSEEVVQLRKSKLGPDHPDTLTSMNNLAIRYAEAGRREEALKLSEEVLQLMKSKLGPDHPDTIKSMNNLAVFYADARRREEALKLSEEVVQLRKSKLGPDHPDTLMSMNNLANRYADAGRREEALKLSEEVVQLRKSKLGPDHPDTIQSMGNLANRYAEAGRREEALKLSEEVLQLRKSTPGVDHHDTSSAMKLHTDLPMGGPDPHATNIESGNSSPRRKTSRSCWRCL